MDIVSRAQWGARAPRQIFKTTWAKRTEFIVHYSGSNPTQTVRSIQNYCMDSKGYSDIDYNALVDQEGRIYEGRTGIWLTVGSHTYQHNTAGIGVCLIGNESTPVSDKVKRSIRWLYDEANRLRRAAGVGGSLSIHPHSAFVSTSCPGGSLRAWVLSGMPVAGTEVDMEVVKGIQTALRDAGFDPGPIDGLWGPRTQGAFLTALKVRGEKGDRGDDGSPGRTPTKVMISGDVVEWA